MARRYNLPAMLAALALLAAFPFLHAVPRDRWLVGLPATVAFAAGGYLLRGVTPSGAIAGWAVALILWLAAGWQAFLTLLTVFVVTLAATKFRYEQKRALRAAERRGGRDAAQVVANLGADAVCATFMFGGWMVAAIAVLAEAAADTVSSEIGQAAGGTPRLVTSGRAVTIGADGGITLIGTLAGALAALLISVLAWRLHLIDGACAVLTTFAGVAGMLFDSLLGATLERRRWMNNDAVNGASTVFAALLAGILRQLA